MAVGKGQLRSRSVEKIVEEAAEDGHDEDTAVDQSDDVDADEE